jgi:cytochrome c biogenesis protein
VTQTSAPGLAPLEFARWIWRQLTSMRTALILLFLLAIAAVPGSVIPQERVDPLAVTRYRQTHPSLSQWYDRLGMFHVYSSIWFGAVYVLLMLSLLGCFIPRTRVYWTALRARPPKAPRNLSRLPASAQTDSSTPPDQAADRAADELRSRRFRVDRYVDGDGRQVVTAEKGYLREAGNLLFHVSLLVVLIGVAYGGLYGYKGAVLVVDGQGFSNTLSQYDEFTPGGRFNADDLPPFSLHVDDFHVSFQPDGPQVGAPREFDADLTYTAEPGDTPQTYDLQVNHPLQVDGTSVYLVGHGYAPDITVRDGDGNVAFSGPVPFLPQDASFTSYGVIKAPDAAPDQLAFEGYFLPTLQFDKTHGPISVFPDALNPALVLLAYHGDLGLDKGLPQSVYELNRSGLKRFTRGDGQPFRMQLQPGQSVTLPNGTGSITFKGVDRFVKLQISRSPAKLVPLAGVLAAIAGLIASLFVRPRRAWVRATDEDGRTVIEVAALDRRLGGDLQADVDALAAALHDVHEEKETV